MKPNMFCLSMHAYAYQLTMAFVGFYLFFWLLIKLYCWSVTHHFMYFVRFYFADKSNFLHCTFVFLINLGKKMQYFSSYFFQKLKFLAKWKLIILMCFFFLLSLVLFLHHQQLDVLKTENQRLRDENGALIRVISKLSK